MTEKVSIEIERNNCVILLYLFMLLTQLLNILMIFSLDVLAEERIKNFPSIRYNVKCLFG
jgi:hypothetical protein